MLAGSCSRGQRAGAAPGRLPAANGAGGGKDERRVRAALEAMSGSVHGAESGTELLARLEGRSSLKELDPTLFADDDSSLHGDIIELHGPEGTGKTELLYHLAARCLLPRAAGGLEAEALFIDTDGHFDLLRLVAVLEHRLLRGSEELVRGCLGRLWVLQCTSSTQLLLTLHSLPALLCSRPALCLLAVDSLSAFYWLDRANGGESVRLQEATLRQCVQLLQQLAATHRLRLLVTTQSLMQKRPGSQAGAGDPDDRSYLCPAWRQAATHRLLLSRQGDSEHDQRFSLLVRHVKSNTSKRHSFVVGESGVAFC